MLRHILWKFWFHKITEISTQERGHFPRDKLPQMLLPQEVMISHSKMSNRQS